MKTRTFKRSKNAWPDETLALTDLVAAQGIEPSDLNPEHSKTHWKWTTTEIGSPQASTASEEFRCEREDMDEHQARQTAMEHLQTFEGNLLDLSTDTHFAYRKIRG